MINNSIIFKDFTNHRKKTNRVLEGKTGREIPESSRLEFLEEFSANNFALSGAEDNTSGPLNRGGIADLPLLRTPLAIRQKFREPSFCK